MEIERNEAIIKLDKINTKQFNNNIGEPEKEKNAILYDSCHVELAISNYQLREIAQQFDELQVQHELSKEHELTIKQSSSRKRSTIMDMDTRKRQKAEKRYNISKQPPLEYVCGTIRELVRDTRKIEISTSK